MWFLLPVDSSVIFLPLLIRRMPLSPKTNKNNLSSVSLSLSKKKSLQITDFAWVFYRYFDDMDDEMDPEIEEAYEKFCLESERKRKQWDVRDLNISLIKAV